MAIILTGCTPAEVQIAEEVFHEAEVAEEAVKHDLECPGVNPQQGIIKGQQNDAKLRQSVLLVSYTQKKKEEPRKARNLGYA